jgi:hypothetical protein
MGGAPYGGDSLAGQTADESAIDGTPVPYLFQVRNMFFLKERCWPLSIPPFTEWSLLILAVVPFGITTARGNASMEITAISDTNGRMTVSPTVKLLFHFLFHILVGAILFVAIAAVAIGLWYATELMQEQRVPYLIWGICFLVSELLFLLDVLCLVFFIVVEVWKFLRASWGSLKSSGVENAGH